MHNPLPRGTCYTAADHYELGRVFFTSGGLDFPRGREGTVSFNALFLQRRISGGRLSARFSINENVGAR
jgi:hypothetical protein